MRVILHSGPAHGIIIEWENHPNPITGHELRCYLHFRPDGWYPKQQLTEVSFYRLDPVGTRPYGHRTATYDPIFSQVANDNLEAFLIWAKAQYSDETTPETFKSLMADPLNK